MLNLAIYEVPLFLFAALLLLSAPTLVSLPVPVSPVVSGSTLVSLPVPTLAISPVVSGSYSLISPVVLFLFLLSCIYSCYPVSTMYYLYPTLEPLPFRLVPLLLSATDY